MSYITAREVLYAHDMKRLQIMIEDDLDGARERLAVEQRTSKAALVRRYVRDRIRPLPALDTDPLLLMAGADSFDPAPVDYVVYG